MKTLTYLATLLALTIQVMVNGQTQNQQVLDKRIDFRNSKEPVKMNCTNSNITFTLEEYNKLISQVDRLKLEACQLKEEARIAELNYFDKKNEASRLSEQISLQEFEENKIVIDVNSKNTEHVKGILSEAENQSNNMKMTAKLLRDKAVSGTPNEKLVLINEASSLEKEQISKLVEISNLKANLTYDTFINNRLIITEFINSEKSDTKTSDEVSQLLHDAEKLMQMAKEMREEANAQMTVYAKYGAISNTEELETSAIDKQNKSIQLIDTVKLNAVIASR